MRTLPSSQSIDDLPRERPDIHASLSSGRFRALAIVPLVVSDRTIGAVVVHWDDDRAITEPDRSFLFTITGAAAQAVERARLTLTEFVNLDRSQHLHQLSSALAAATTPGDVATWPSPAAAGRWVRSPRSCGCPPGERGLACLASSGHPALLSRRMVPLDGTHAGRASPAVGPSCGIARQRRERDLETAEIVPRVLSELPHR